MTPADSYTIADLCNDLLNAERVKVETDLCREKGIHAAAESLGHTNLQTTTCYTKTDTRTLRENQDLID